ncbi:hypothetical protein GOB94_02835 [Granulicella sp. 5B5]|uniref:hypothetical protein n=1 Tax=Granulicella sp. 5B5 TaxID=1617967 RepID=UPI0015F6DEED|nr:hypothetical protein [Granulicella sp. 5B5]QMV17751.1 hypothetical protein GOB94_02835 [Granulicella sp. 5B5]
MLPSCNLLRNFAAKVSVRAFGFERTGQYAAGTTFAEGLVPFNGRWFLYYGTEDSFVGVATAPITNVARLSP